LRLIATQATGPRGPSGPGQERRRALGGSAVL